MASRLDVWLSVEKGYKVLKATPTDPDEFKLMTINIKAKHDILEGLSKIVQSKVVISCSSTK